MKSWSLGKKFVFWWGIGLVTLALMAFLCPPIHGQGSNIGQVRAAGINSNYYVGISPYANTIQSAATAACAAGYYSHKGTVIIDAGILPSDTPTAVTGCTGVGIIDRRAFPWVCYSWTGSGPYAATGCVTGGSGGAINTVTGAGGNRAQSVVTTSGNVVITTFDQQLYASQYATIPLLITACGSANTKITVDTAQSFTLAANQTFPSNCSFNFTQQGVWTIAGAFTLTFNGNVEANLAQHFAGAATIAGLRGAVRAEWWGAVPYTTSALAAAGANDVTKGQAAINSLTRGGYVELQCAFYHMGGLIISQNSQGIIGDCTGGYDTIGAGINSPLAAIVSTSATETIVAVQGTSSSNFLEFVTLKNLTAQRSVTPTGTARGISIDYAVRNVVNNVSSNDSVRNFYFHFAGGGGVYERLTALWGFGSVAGSSYTTGTVTGYYLDSADGNAQNSLTLSNSDAACGNVTSIPTTGFLASGINVSDTFTINFSTASCSHGQDIENTGTSNFVAQDILFTNSVLNVCGIDCLKISGAESTTDVAPHVAAQGGNYFPAGTNSVGVLIQNSSNVAISGVQILPGASGIQGVSLSNVDGFAITGNTIAGIDFGTGIGISCANSTHGTISNNVIKVATSSGTGIKNVGCTLVSEQGNTIAGNSSNLGTGMSFDSGSSNNGPWSLNKIDSATVTTPISDAGTNNNPSLVAGTNITITGNWPNQVINSTAGGLTNPMAGVGDFIRGGAAGVPTNLAAPTVAGTYDICESPSGTAVAPTWCLSPITKTATTHLWINSFTAATGVYTATQPAFTDVSGIATAAQGGTGVDTSSSTGYPSIAGGTWSVATAAATFATLYKTVATTLGDIMYGGASGTPTRLAGPTIAGSYNLCETPSGSAVAPAWCNSPLNLAAVSHQFMTSYTSATGVYTLAQPAFSDISGTAAAAQIPASLTSTTSVNSTAIPSSSTLALHIANGTATLGTSAIASAACATVVTVAGTGIQTTDPVGWGFNGDVTAVTGYTPVTTGALTIFVYPSAGNVNFKVCNLTTASITPGAVTLNWTVIR
jgi:hypothetical protein